jgi:hypothetical protein
MKRLTRRLYNGNPDCAYCTGEYITKKGCSNRCELRITQKAKLAAYEDTGLEPEEITALKERAENAEKALEAAKIDMNSIVCGEDFDPCWFCKYQNSIECVHPASCPTSRYYFFKWRL